MKRIIQFFAHLLPKCVYKPEDIKITVSEIEEFNSKKGNE